MSGRQLHRLRKQLGRDADLAPSVSPAEEDSSENESSDSEAGPANPFDILDQDSENDDNVDEESENDSPICRQPQARQPQKGKPSAHRKSRQGQQEREQEEDDIDEILAALLQAKNEDRRASGNLAVASGARPLLPKPLLAASIRHLKAGEELKRMFGSDAMQDDDDEAGAAYAGYSRRIRRLAARGLLQRQQLKKGVLIDPGETWPAFDGGFSMEATGGPGSSQVFNYTYSAGYKALDEMFEEGGAAYDPQEAAAILQVAPYHLDSLLAMHNFYRSMGENASADDALARCLYALEMAWHPSFSPATGHTQTQYNAENKPLFKALFLYAQGLSRRGLPRTALEVCKLLLSLDPEDPMGACMCIDYYALRAGQYEFVPRLASEVERGGASLTLLPNIAFSNALALRHERQKKKKKSHTSEDADDALLKALLSFPMALRPLLDKAGVLDAAWEEVLRQPFFANASGAHQSATLAQLVAIFVERQHTLWKQPEVNMWLRSVAQRAATASAEDLPEGLSRADWAAACEAAYPPCATSAYQGVLFLSSFSDSVERLPPEELEAAHRGLEQAMAERQQQQPEQLEGGTLRALLRSLLPWANVGQAPDYDDDDER